MVIGFFRRTRLGSPLSVFRKHFVQHSGCCTKLESNLLEKSMNIELYYLPSLGEAEYKIHKELVNIRSIQKHRVVSCYKRVGIGCYR